MGTTGIFKLCDLVRETGFSIHKFLRNGHLEKVYETAMVNRLQKQGLAVVPQHPLQVFDEEGSILGNFVADLFAENCLIVELKAIRYILDEHIARLLGYLRASRIEHGLLINFGGPKYQIKKFILNDALEGNLKGNGS